MTSTFESEWYAKQETSRTRQQADTNGAPTTRAVLDMRQSG
jgi:hypothetical protein